MQTGMQKFSSLLQREQFCIQGWMKQGVGRMYVFKRKSDHILETVRDTAKVTINN